MNDKTQKDDEWINKVMKTLGDTSRDDGQSESSKERVITTLTHRHMSPN